MEKFSFSGFKIEKVNFLLRVQPKFFAVVFLTLEVAQQAAELLDHF